MGCRMSYPAFTDTGLVHFCAPFHLHLQNEYKPSREESRPRGVSLGRGYVVLVFVFRSQPIRLRRTNVARPPSPDSNSHAAAGSGTGAIVTLSKPATPAALPN